MPRYIRRSSPAFHPADAVQPLEARVLFDVQPALLIAPPVGPTAGLLTVATTPLAAATATVTSTLWGKTGERWSPSGRLIDYSYAGYHNGDDPIPSTYATSRNVA